MAFSRRLCGPNQICRTSAATQAMPQSINQSQQLPVDVLQPPPPQTLLSLFCFFFFFLFLLSSFTANCGQVLPKHFGSHTPTHTTLCWLIKYAHKFKSRILLPRALPRPFPPSPLPTAHCEKAKRNGFAFLLFD